MTTPETSTNGATPSQAMTLSPQQARALELREQIDTDASPRAIVPRTFAEAQSFAGAIAHSSLVPEALKERAPDILMIVLAGAELEIPPIRALSMFHVIEGVPKLSADALAAICSRSPLCEYLEPREQSAERVTWAIKRRGRPEMIMSYSMEEAKLAGLVRPTRSGAPGNWQKFPRNMMNARCKADLCRMVLPEVCAGLVTAEEARDFIDVDPEGGKPTGFTAPPPPQVLTQPTPSAAAPAKRGPGRPPGKPIDAASTETPTQGAATPPPAPTTSPTVTSTGSPLPPDAARDQALAKASENAKALEESRRDPTPSSNASPPSSSNAAAPASSAPDAQASSSPTDPGSSSASGESADGFGDEAAPMDPPIKTIGVFEFAVSEAVKSKDPNKLEDVKRIWVPWSKVEGDLGGKQHAHRMREVFAKAKADMGIR